MGLEVRWYDRRQREPGPYRSLRASVPMDQSEPQDTAV